MNKIVVLNHFFSPSCIKKECCSDKSW